MSKVCQDCDDGNGFCLYPYVGLAPHTHQLDCNNKVILGSTVFLPESEFPKNFIETVKGEGVYTHCLTCGNRGIEIDIPGFW